MPAFVPMEFMHPEPLQEKPVAKAPEAPAPMLGAASAAFVSPISVEPWCDRASQPAIAAVATESASSDAPIDPVFEPATRFGVGVGVGVGAAVGVANEVDAQMELEPQALAAPAISIAAPLRAADSASRARPSGDDELTAISDFVGRVLEGRTAAAVSIEPKPLHMVEPAPRPEPAPRGRAAA
jgi:hypothetical protein